MTQHYDGVARFLHWSIAALVLLQFVTGFSWGFFERGSEMRFYLFRTHIMLGSTILFLACVRLGWRLTHRAPPLPAMPAATALAARMTHFLLYAAILVQPVLGLLTITAFGKSLGRWPGKAHIALSYFILAIVCLHVLAALWHHFIRRDGLLNRMSLRRAPPAA